MKLHLTAKKQVYYADVPFELVQGKRINEQVHLPDPLPGIPEGKIIIRGASGVDGTPMRADYFGVIPKKLWVNNCHKKRFRPNRIDKNMVVVDCIITDRV